MSVKTLRMLMLGTLLLLQACGGGGSDSGQGATSNVNIPPATDTGGGGNTNTPDPVVTATPALHLALKDANNFAVRVFGNISTSAPIVVTFYNLSADGVDLSAPYQRVYTQPAYPLTVASENSYNRITIKYSNSDLVADQTEYINAGAVLATSKIAYAASSLTAAEPKVLPLMGTSTVILMAPDSGDYGCWVGIRYQKADGSIEPMWIYKPVLPYAISLKPGFVAVGVSTGTQTLDGTFASGPERVWEYGALPNTGTGGNKKPLDGEIITIIK